MKLGAFKPIFQQVDDSCFSATLKVVLDKFGFKLSVKVINKAVGYKRGHAVIGDNTAGLDNLHNKYLRPKGYTIRRGGGTKMTFDVLKEIVNNISLSPPIVSVSQDYFRERDKRYRAIGIEGTQYQHQLVVSDVDEANGSIDVFDPLAFRNKNGIVKVLITNFADYWDATARDTIWIYKGKDEPILDAGQLGISEWM